LAIRGRDRFQKIYDLTERVFPNFHAQPAPNEGAHVEWACSTALERLGIATPAEVAAYFDAITIAQAAQWSKMAVREGRISPVLVESEIGLPRKAFALHDWQRRVRRASEAPDRIRPLAPFDPIIRDRKRALRLFGFDYRFEAFVPAPKRKYGYYVLPLLERDRLVGRLDARTDRDASALVVERLWWEPKIKPTRERQRKLSAGLAVLARQIGVEQITYRK
jgi:uncharacterized protein YcaQ